MPTAYIRTIFSQVSRMAGRSEHDRPRPQPIEIRTARRFLTWSI